MPYVPEPVPPSVAPSNAGIRLPRSTDLNGDGRRSTLERELHAKLIWEHDSIKTSFYQNAEGKVTLLWPWRILDMWRWTKEVNADDYQLGS